MALSSLPTHSEKTLAPMITKDTNMTNMPTNVTQKDKTLYEIIARR